MLMIMLSRKSPRIIWDPSPWAAFSRNKLISNRLSGEIISTSVDGCAIDVASYTNHHQTVLVQGSSIQKRFSLIQSREAEFSCCHLGILLSKLPFSDNPSNRSYFFRPFREAVGLCYRIP